MSRFGVCVMGKVVFNDSQERVGPTLMEGVARRDYMECSSLDFGDK